jgi:hypothetical protein
MGGRSRAEGSGVFLQHLALFAAMVENRAMEYNTPTRPSPAQRDIRRTAYAARLWITDALCFRFGDYHWERRRRRMKRYDQQRRARPR